MTVSIEVEEDAWLALSGLESLARSAVLAVLTRDGIDPEDCEVAVLFTGDESIAAINAEWRGKDRATNVLSFPAPGNMPVPHGERRPLGDVVLAHGVVHREAEEQGKSLHDHTAHLIVHGTLHLLGYDHENDDEAKEMESLETTVLKSLGISDPYE